MSQDSRRTWRHPRKARLRGGLGQGRGTLRPGTWDGALGESHIGGCSPIPALGPLAYKATKRQGDTALLWSPTLHRDKASWSWLEDGTPGQTAGGGASPATGLPPHGLHPSRPGPLPCFIGRGAWTLDPALGPALARSPGPSGLPRPHLPAGSALAPPRRAVGPRRRPGGRALGRAGSVPWPRGRRQQPGGGASMGRRCWRRRALAAACLGAALLLLGAAPRALRPGECPPGPGGRPTPRRPGPSTCWGHLLSPPGLGDRAGWAQKASRSCPAPRSGDRSGLTAFAWGRGSGVGGEGIGPSGEGSLIYRAPTPPPPERPKPLPVNRMRGRGEA